jgi:hypothetical protein
MNSSTVVTNADLLHDMGVYFMITLFIMAAYFLILSAMVLVRTAPGRNKSTEPGAGKQEVGGRPPVDNKYTLP